MPVGRRMRARLGVRCRVERPGVVDDDARDGDDERHVGEDGTTAISVAEEEKRLVFYDPHTWVEQGVLPTPVCAGIDHGDFAPDGWQNLEGAVPDYEDKALEIVGLVIVVALLDETAHGDTLAAAVAKAKGRWGRVDVLHYNVGVSIAGGDAESQCRRDQGARLIAVVIATGNDFRAVEAGADRLRVDRNRRAGHARSCSPTARSFTPSARARRR